MKQKVIILGAGIGGLSAAHELSKYPDSYEITIIERNGHIGGQAAEIFKYDKKGKTNEIHFSSDKKHIALCWHAVSSSYKYFLDIMDEIIDENGIKVISHLKPLRKFIYADENINYIEYENSFITGSYDNFYEVFSHGYEHLYGNPPSRLEMIKLYTMYLYANMISRQRLEQYDSKLWSEYVDSFSAEMKKWILDSTSIYLGMDYAKLSVHFMFDLFRKISAVTKLDSKNVFYSFDGSMHNVLFKPWHDQLMQRGVVFLLSHEVIAIQHIEKLSTLSTITVKCDDHHGDCIHDFHADILINAMDTKNLAKLYPKCANDISLKFNDLHNGSEQVQTQVIYYLPYRLQPINTEPTILILHNSPWFLMIRIEGDIWSLSHSDILSCGIGIWDRPGINKKCAINCTREEIAEECWKQIMSSQHNLKLSTNIPKWDMWDSFKFNPITMKMETFEPKFSNNINTLKLRPNFQDAVYTNLYHATSYTRNYTNIYNMESAAESGVKVANIIINKKKLTDNVNFVKKPHVNKKIVCENIEKIDNIDTIKDHTSEIPSEVISTVIQPVKSDNILINPIMKKTIKRKNTKWYFKLCRKIDCLIFKLFN